MMLLRPTYTAARSWLPLARARNGILLREAPEDLVGHLAGCRVVELTYVRVLRNADRHRRAWISSS